MPTPATSHPRPHPTNNPQTPITPPLHGAADPVTPSPNNNASHGEPAEDEDDIFDDFRSRAPAYDPGEVEKALVSKGKIFTRTIDAFRDITLILDHGFSRNTTLDSSHYTSRERRHHALYDQLLLEVPLIHDELRARGPGGSRAIARILENGRKSARSDDVSSIKNNIGLWHDFTPPLNSRPKNMRGFRHAECGRLLCPTIYDWDDPEVQAGLQKKSKKYDAGSQNWPVFLWRDEKVDSSDYHEGFLKNELIVKAALRIFRGLSAANSNGEQIRGTRKGIAAIHGMTVMTTGAIVYATMMVHFALSSQSTFSAGGSNTSSWPYRKFYQELVNYVEKDMPRDAYDRLLEWWNGRIFPEVYDEDYDDCDTENDRRPVNSMAAKMLAQARAARVDSSDAVLDGSSGSGSSGTPLADASNHAA